MEPYIPGEQPSDGEYIKLNTNENPFPPSKEVVENLFSDINENLKKYPDPLCNEFRKLYAKQYGLEPNQIIVGNGSDETIRMIFHLLIDQGDTIGILNPTYSLYPVVADMYGGKIKKYDLIGENYEIPEEIFADDSKLLILCNPNPPIGTFYDIALIDRICKRIKGVLMVDEAYVDFAEDTCLRLLKDNNNLIICRTFSKSFSLAGMRIGIGIANKDMIDALYKIKDSYNINRLSQSAGIGAMKSVDYYKENVEIIKSNRVYLRNELIKLGFNVPKTQSNFVFAKIDNAKQIYQQLKEKKILVRYFSDPILANGVRITVGTKEEIDILIKTLKDILEKD